MGMTTLNKLKIKRPNIINIAWFSFFYFNTISNHSLLSQIPIILMVGLVLFQAIKTKKIKFHTYFFLEALFIVYCFFQVAMGVAVYKEVAYSMIVTLVISWIFNVCAFNCLQFTYDIKYPLKVINSALFWAVITLLLVGRNNLFDGRFSNDSVNFSLLGIKFAFSAVSLAAACALGFLFTTYLYHETHKLKCILYDCIFIFCILATGVRKSFIVVIIGMIVIFLLKKPKKVLKNILLIFLIGITTYYLLMRIPLFYTMIGSRMEGLFELFSTGTTTEESATTRVRLMQLGMEYFREKPFFGYGINNFKSVASSQYYTHSNFVEILFSGGIIGFIIFYSRYLLLLFISVRILSENKFKDKELAFFIVMFLVYTIMEYGQVTYFERSFLFWNILTLSYCSKYSKKNRSYYDS